MPKRYLFQQRLCLCFGEFNWNLANINHFLIILFEIISIFISSPLFFHKVAKGFLRTLQSIYIDNLSGVILYYSASI